MITSIDYAKAFNRLSFQHCLRAFARKGTSTEIIAILSTFLSNRAMSIKVADTWSTPRPVYGGVPQGSILGVLLFNVSTDNLEDEDENDMTFIDTYMEDPNSDSGGGSSGGEADLSTERLVSTGDESTITPRWSPADDGHTRNTVDGTTDWSRWSTSPDEPRG